MPASLIEQLADHLHLEREEAKDVLAALTARLNEEIEDTGEAEWPGLGRFHNDEGGLRYEPEEALALAVNQRYAGLKPVAVGGAGSLPHKQEDASPEPDEPAAEADVPLAETDELDEGELDDEGWQPPEDSDEDHPLGPMPRQPFEEADFSVLAGFDETRERTDPSVPAAEAEPDDEDIPFEQAEADHAEAPASVDVYDLSDRDDADHDEAALADENAGWDDTDVDSAADVPEEDGPTGEPVGKDSPFFEEWSESDFEMEDEEEEDEVVAETEPLEPATELHQPDEPEPEPIQDEDIALEPAAAQAAAEDVEPTTAPDADDEDREQAAFVPPTVTPKAEPDAAAAAPVAAAAAAENTTREPARPARPSRSATSHTVHEEKERSRTPMILGGVIAAVVVLLLGLWLFSGDDVDPGGGAGPLTEQTSPAAQAPPDDESPAADNAPDAGDQTDDVSSEAAPSAEAGTQDAPETQDATPGGSASPESALTAIDRNAGAWTLVVASWTIESRAEEEAAQYAEQFRAQGHPVDILHHTENGVTRHRVAVGEFSDQEAAEAARESLTGLPEGTWLLRVRPGM